jgi:hypothetical protein
MAAPTIIGLDQTANRQGQINTAKNAAASGTNGFDKVLSSLDYARATMGPAAVQSAATFGTNKSASIVSAAVNSYSGGGLNATLGYGGSGGNYSTGGPMFLDSTPVTDPSMQNTQGSSTDQFQNQLAQMQANNSATLMLQFEAGNMQTSTQMISNIENIRQSTLSRVVQNMKV